MSKSLFLINLTLLGLLLFITISASAQNDELPQLEAMWRHHQYAEVLPKLLDYRDRVNDRSASVDYMIATSACRLSDPNVRKQGDYYFNWILKNYVLNDKDGDLVENERKQCSKSVPPAAPPLSTTPTLVGALFYAGKETFYSKANTGRRSGTIERSVNENEGEPLPVISPETLRSRLIKLSQRNGAPILVQGQLHDFEEEVRLSPTFTMGGKDSFTIERTEHFVIASMSRHTHAQLAQIGDGLEQYLKFYLSTYGMKPPTYFITVYLVPNNLTLAEFARQMHGIKVDEEGTIGYSYPYDQSIVAIIPRMIYGTLKHELFHLMVRGNFGDIPAWLEEGMASLYEVSRVRETGIVGIPSWRGRVLLDPRRRWPRLQTLVTMNWQAFAGKPPELSTPEDLLIRDKEYYQATTQEVNNAVARYFVLYLQERRKLVDVYQAFRTRKVNGNPDEQSVSILEVTLNQKLESVENDFVSWFRRIPRYLHR
jgi:hypothetical protein